MTYHLNDSEENKFLLYLRQNTRQGMEDDVSCGLSFVLPRGEVFNLVRYNGPSHQHRNKLEKENLDFVPHIHKATRNYLDKTGKADGYTEATTKYKTLEGALYCILKDCNIKGLMANPDQPGLFDET